MSTSEFRRYGAAFGTPVDPVDPVVGVDTGADRPTSAEARDSHASPVGAR